MTILNRLDRGLAVLFRVALALSLVVIAGALSVNAAFTVLQYKQSEAFYDFASDSAVYYSDDSDGEIRTESTTIVTQESMVIEGTGSEPTEAIELLSEGLWVVRVHFLSYEPPKVGNIPTVNLNSIDGKGGAGWSGNSWMHIYVTAEWDVVRDLDFGSRSIAPFTSGEVVLQIADLPDDVDWVAKFERLGELKLPER